VKLNEFLAVVGQFFTAIQLLLGRISLSDEDLPKVSGFFPEWSATEGVGNNTRRRWKTNETGKPLLYVSTKNVSAGGAPPDQNPGSWKLLG